MTDSDSLRGDPNHDPTRRHHPELRELDTLRALLRPRMTEEGDPTPTDALRGMFVEIERLRITTSEGDRCRALESEIASRSQAHETTRQTLQLLRGRLHEALSLSTDGASDKDIFERIEQLSTAQTTIRAHDLKHIESLGQRIRDLERQIQQERKQYHAGAQAVAERLRNIMSTCFGGSRSGDLYFQLADMEKWIPKFTSEWSANHGRWHELCQRLGLAAHIDNLAAVLKHIEQRVPADLVGSLEHERKRSKLLAEEATAEQRLASAAATGHDHARGLLVAIAEVFGRVDDLDSLPAKVRELSDARRASLAKVDRLQAAKSSPTPWWSSTTGRARCPVCHRMAPVKDGCFQPHTSGESTCSGSAGQTGLLRAWREWLMGKDVGLHYGWSDSELRAKFDEHAAEARRLTDALQKHIGDLAEALNEKTAALDAVPAQLAALRDTADAAHAAMRRLGWDGSTYPDEWAIACFSSNARFSEDVRTLREKVGVLEAQLVAAGDDTDEIEAVREAIGVPAGKPLMSYVVHAAAGMQALAILGWQGGHPMEWATKRAAAEADLRGAFAEAELVGSDHAAMVRQLWGDIRRLSASTTDARICLHSKTHDIKDCKDELAAAAKRIQVFRDWLIGMTPAGTSTALSDDELIRAVQFVPRADFDAQTVWTDSLAKECAHLRSLIEVMADIKRRLNALPSLST